jgi:uncharacterized protein YbjQ (UPF0145 family)
MKIKDVTKLHGVAQNKLEHYLRNQSEIQYKDGFSGIVIDGGDVGTLIANLNQEEARLAKEKSEEEARLATKQEALANMLITSGFNFDGYTITKYSGYISGDDAISIDRGTGGWFTSATDVGESLLGSLAQIRRNALLELKEAAYALGCNAVVGVDFDYLTLDPETASSSGGTLYLPYVFAVTANGNAVIIERNKTIG